MVFDHPAIKDLRVKHKNEPSMYLPLVLKIDRYPGALGEKECIEELVQSVPPKIQNKWLGDFLTDDNSQHIGAWWG